MHSYVNGRVVQVPRSLRGKKKKKQQSTFTTTTGVSATKGVWQSAAHLRQCRKRLEMSDNNNTRAVTALALRKRRRAREEFSFGKNLRRAGLVLTI